MTKGTTKTLAFLLSTLVCTAALAQMEPPPGWGKPAPLSPANGQGQVSFYQGGTAMTLPLQKIEISLPRPNMYMVSLSYVDAAQKDKLELAFTSMPNLGANDPRMVTGFLVDTAAHGLSRAAANRTTCKLTITKLTAQEASGTLACKGMVDLSAEKAAPEVTDVKFSGKLNSK